MLNENRELDNKVSYMFLTKYYSPGSKMLLNGDIAYLFVK